MDLYTVQGEGGLMGKLLKFPPKQSKARKLFDVSRERVKSIRRPSLSSIGGFFAAILMCARLPLFLVLYWLRTPIVMIANFLAFPLLILAIFAGYAFPERMLMAWSLGVLSFLGFAFGYGYDLVLLALSPQEMVRTL